MLLKSAYAEKVQGESRPTSFIQTSTHPYWSEQHIFRPCAQGLQDSGRSWQGSRIQGSPCQAMPGEGWKGTDRYRLLVGLVLSGINKSTGRSHLWAERSKMTRWGKGLAGKGRDDASELRSKKHHQAAIRGWVVYQPSCIIMCSWGWRHMLRRLRQKVPQVPFNSWSCHTSLGEAMPDFTKAGKKKHLTIPLLRFYTSEPNPNWNTNTIHSVLDPEDLSLFRGTDIFNLAIKSLNRCNHCPPGFLVAQW